MDLPLYARPDWNVLINHDTLEIFYRGLRIFEVHPDYIEEYGTEQDGTSIMNANQDRQREWITEHFKDEILEQIEDRDYYDRHPETEQERYERENDL